MWPMFESHVLVLDREYFGVSKIVDFYTVMNIADRFNLDDSMHDMKQLCAVEWSYSALV
jgi:uncharacterized protein YlaN (UPF0358 family)